MALVIQMLNSLSMTLPVPLEPVPIYIQEYNAREGDSNTLAESEAANSCQNDVSITDLYPRPPCRKMSLAAHVTLKLGIPHENEQTDEVLEEFTESEYDMESEIENEDLGDDINKNVNDIVEKPYGSAGVEEGDNEIVSASDSVDDNIVESCEELDNLNGSDEEEHSTKFPVFNAADMYDPKFAL
ncbi:hypothetical protein RD792_007739 [Penstemon davidsonii]|uniref:Uncharacterized protein n=1 Tax=Penstemon davidsonii TaxID=160366 RepID=A0ABR0D788_9LAMI|nr:hypothetical protein RD792_007739 [Penstemon davidsonii]